MPKLSLVVPYYECDEGKRPILDRFLKSVEGQYDELVLVAQPKGAGIGFVPAVNMGYSLATGDFIILACDDIVLIEGDLRKLCDPEAVVSAQVNGLPVQDFWGTMWCTPRWVYEKIGPIDENYKNGIFYDDNEYYEQIIRVCNPYTNIRVVVDHPHGGETLEHTPERDKKIEINKQYFLKKWGFPPYIKTTNTAIRYGLNLPTFY